jgi:hypothetical protein
MTTMLDRLSRAGVRAGVLLVTFLLGLLLVALTGEVRGSLCQRQENARIAQVLTLVRGVGVLRREKAPSQAEAGRLAGTMREILEELKGDTREAVVLYTVYAEGLAGHVEAPKNMLIEVAAQADKPEVLFVKTALIARDGQARSGARSVSTWGELATLVPLSDWAIDRDMRRSPLLGVPNPPPPSVPETGGLRDSLSEVGRQYEELARPKEAVDAYLAGVYSSMGWRVIPDDTNAWLRVAAVEAEQGRQSLMLRACLHAASCSERGLEGARDLLLKRTRRTALDRPKVVPKPDPDRLVQIANLYRKHNLHPLALRVLSELPDEEGPIWDLKEEIRQEWSEIISKRSRAQLDYTLGFKNSDVADWGQVKIPMPSETFWIPVEKESPGRQ